MAGILRPGNSGSNTAVDHISVLDLALAQIPDHLRHGEEILVRCDSAGASHAFLRHIRSLREHGLRSFFSVGVAITEPVRTAIQACLDWLPAIDGDRNLRDGAEIAELTHLVDLSAYPPGTRMSDHTGAAYEVVEHEAALVDPCLAELGEHARLEERLHQRQHALVLDPAAVHEPRRLRRRHARIAVGVDPPPSLSSVHIARPRGLADPARHARIARRPARDVRRPPPAAPDLPGARADRPWRRHWRPGGAPRRAPPLPSGGRSHRGSLPGPHRPLAQTLATRPVAGGAPLVLAIDIDAGPSSDSVGPLPDVVRLGLEADGRFIPLAELDGRYLSTEVAGGYTGRVVGMYAAQGTVAFDWYEYTGRPG